MTVDAPQDAHLAAAVQKLIDKQQLQELVLRYCRAVDRADLELLLSCYHPDAIDDHGTFSGSPVDIFTPVLERLRHEPPTHHSLTNVSFELDGDIAYGESYNEMRTLDDSGNFHHGGFGRYIDRYERRDGEWRIAHRLAIIEYIPPKPGRDTSKIVRGSKDREDPSYQRML